MWGDWGRFSHGEAETPAWNFGCGAEGVKAGRAYAELSGTIGGGSWEFLRGIFMLTSQEGVTEEGSTRRLPLVRDGSSDQQPRAPSPSWRRPEVVSSGPKPEPPASRMDVFQVGELGSCLRASKSESRKQKRVSKAAEIY